MQDAIVIHELTFLFLQYEEIIFNYLLHFDGISRRIDDCMLK